MQCLMHFAEHIWCRLPICCTGRAGKFQAPGVGLLYIPLQDFNVHEANTTHGTEKHLQLFLPSHP
jgi:hypothetical protein